MNNHIEKMAAAMWREEVVTFKSIAKYRTPKAFIDESVELKAKWRGIAQVAFNTRTEARNTALQEAAGVLLDMIVTKKAEPANHGVYPQLNERVVNKILALMTKETDDG